MKIEHYYNMKVAYVQVGDIKRRKRSIYNSLQKNKFFHNFNRDGYEYIVSLEDVK